MAGERWDEGETVNAAVGVPGSVTDCSGWEADIPDHLWDEGETVNAAVGVPGSVTDCSAWETWVSPVWMAIDVRYAAVTPNATVAGHTAAVIRALQRLAPDLGLEYDLTRSRSFPQESSLVIALVPTVSVPDLEARLYALGSKVRAAEPAVPVVGVRVRYDEPLAA